MLEVLFDFGAVQAELARHARDGARSPGELIDQLTSERHSSIMGAPLQQRTLEGQTYMPEVLLRFSTPVAGPDGLLYEASAIGTETADGLWHGWIEFTAGNVSERVATDRETTQPNRTDTLYWATGLTHIYLEGALTRALDVSRSRHAAQHLQTHSS